MIPLTGVLRTELPDRLTYALARYIRTPVVSVQPLIRVAIEGDVAHPGFYALAPEMPIMDALTAAGGLTRNAHLGKARVERAGVTVLHGFTLENAVRSGRTFDALNLRAGDRLYIPRQARLVHHRPDGSDSADDPDHHLHHHGDLVITP